VYNRDTRQWGYVDHYTVLRHESSSYELVPFVKPVVVDTTDAEMLAEASHTRGPFIVEDGRLLVFVVFDVHHNFLFKFDVAPVFESSVPSALGVGRAPSPADHLWFAIHRYYYEVGMGHIKSPRVLALIAGMVNDPAIDWDRVVSNAIKQNATAPCWYWLTLFRSLGASGIPREAVDQLRAHHAASDRNWGWQIARLFELDESVPDIS
jgi:hypothetical protein